MHVTTRVYFHDVTHTRFLMKCGQQNCEETIVKEKAPYKLRHTKMAQLRPRGTPCSPFLGHLEDVLCLPFFRSTSMTSTFAATVMQKNDLDFATHHKEKRAIELKSLCT